MVLGGAYFHTLGLGSGEELDHYLAQEKVDVIVADCRGGEKHSLEFLEGVRKEQPKAKVVLVSEAMDLPLVIRSIRLGVKEVFQGPLDAKAVARCVGDLVAQNKETGETLRRADWTWLEQFFQGSGEGGTPEVAPKAAPPAKGRRAATLAGTAVDEELAKEREALGAERVRLAEEAKRLKDGQDQLMRRLAESNRAANETPAGADGDALQKLRREREELRMTLAEVEAERDALALAEEKFKAQVKALEGRHAEELMKLRAGKADGVAAPVPAAPADSGTALAAAKARWSEEVESLRREGERERTELTERLTELEQKAQTLRDQLRTAEREHVAEMEALQEEHAKALAAARQEKADTPRSTAKTGTEPAWEKEKAKLRELFDEELEDLRSVHRRELALLKERLRQVTERTEGTEPVAVVREKVAQELRAQFEEEMTSLQATHRRELSAMKERVREVNDRLAEGVGARDGDDIWKAELAAAKRSHEEEVAALQERLRRLKERAEQDASSLQALETAHAKELEQMREAHARELVSLQTRSKELSERLQSGSTSTRALEEQHEWDLQTLREQHAQALARAKETHQRELSVWQTRLQAQEERSGEEIRLLKEQETQHVRELARIKERHQRELTLMQQRLAELSERSSEEAAGLRAEAEARWQDVVAKEKALQGERLRLQQLQAALDQETSAVEMARAETEERRAKMEARRQEMERQLLAFEQKRLEREREDRSAELHRSEQVAGGLGEAIGQGERRLRLLRDELAALARALADRETALRAQEAKVEALLAKADSDLRHAAQLEDQVKARAEDLQERLRAAEERAAEIIAAAQRRVSADERVRSGLTEALALERASVRQAEEKYLQACGQVQEQLQALADREAQLRRREFQLEERELTMRQALQRAVVEASALSRGDTPPRLATEEAVAAVLGGPAGPAATLCDEMRQGLEEGRKHFANKAQRLDAIRGELEQP